MKFRWTVFLAATTLTAQSHAASLHEWTLPSLASRPLQIDAQHTPGQVYFVDLGTSEIDHLNPSTNQLERWAPPTFNGADPASIEVDTSLGNPLVWVTDPPYQAIGRLDPTSGNYDSWIINSAPVYRPVVASVDRVDQAVFFTSYDGVHAPAIGELLPGSNSVNCWPLPSAVADPGDRLDGLVAASSDLVYFTVSGKNHHTINRLRAYDLPPNVVTWDLSVYEPGQIAWTSSGRVAMGLVPLLGTVALFDEGASQYTWWQDSSPSNPLSSYLSVMPGSSVPWFLGDNTSYGFNVTRVLTSIPGTVQPVSSFATEVKPGTFSVKRHTDVPSYRSASLARIDTLPGWSTTGAFAHLFPVAGDGAISAYNSDHVYFTETGAQRVAWLVP